MARNHANNGRIYRAVITRNYANDSGPFTVTYGPYDERHTAQARITAAENAAERSRDLYLSHFFVHTAEGHIETAEVVWTREA